MASQIKRSTGIPGYIFDATIHGLMTRLEGRFWELDLLRGCAVIMMVVFHLAYDLNYFGVYGLDMYSGFWFYLARITAGTFILLVGVSLSLSSERARLLGQQRLFIKLLKRGLKIFALGLGITAATYLLIANGFIVFGILHFIGASIILAYPFLNMKAQNIIIGLIIIAVGLYLQGMAVNFPWLLWLGLPPRDFYTLDYIPLFPWFGVILIGIFIGNTFYGGYRRRIDPPDLSGYAPTRFFILLGRISLPIYLIHQPVLIMILYLSGLIHNSSFF
jgi:uncharacterized membrane protein